VALLEAFDGILQRLPRCLNATENDVSLCSAHVEGRRTLRSALASFIAVSRAAADDQHVSLSLLSLLSSDAFERTEIAY
jgi:hypothetical protein